MSATDSTWADRFIAIYLIIFNISIEGSYINAHYQAIIDYYTDCIVNETRKQTTANNTTSFLTEHQTSSTFSPYIMLCVPQL